MCRAQPALSSWKVTRGRWNFKDVSPRVLSKATPLDVNPSVLWSDFANGINVPNQPTLESGRYPGLPGGPSVITRAAITEEEGGRVGQRRRVREGSSEVGRWRARETWSTEGLGPALLLLKLEEGDLELKAADGEG